MVDDVPRDNESSLVKLLENLNCELKGIETPFCRMSCTWVKVKYKQQECSEGHLGSCKTRGGRFGPV